MSKTKIKSVLFTVKAYVPVIIIIYIVLFFLTFFKLHPDEWHNYTQDLFDEISLERTNINADYEAWRITYGFPLIPYATSRASLVDDGSFTLKEIEAKATEIAKKADDKFGGNTSKITVEYFEDPEKPFFYIIIRKRCVSLWQVY